MFPQAQQKPNIYNKLNITIFYIFPTSKNLFSTS